MTTNYSNQLKYTTIDAKEFNFEDFIFEIVKEEIKLNK